MVIPSELTVRLSYGRVLSRLGPLPRLSSAQEESYLSTSRRVSRNARSTWSYLANRAAGDGPPVVSSMQISPIYDAPAL